MKLWLKEKQGEEQEYFDVDVWSFAKVTLVALTIIYSILILAAFFIGIVAGL